jgi:hypothetical protein
MSDFNDAPAALSTSALQAKLKDLKARSAKHSQLLTAKLASSQSGQNLLHIGTSLSTLPPDLHSLLTQLHPVLSAAENTEKLLIQRLEKLVACGNEIRVQQRRVEHAHECADLYLDLLAAEKIVTEEASYYGSERHRSPPMEMESQWTVALGKWPGMVFRMRAIASFFLCLILSLTRYNRIIDQSGSCIVVGTVCTRYLVPCPGSTDEY